MDSDTLEERLEESGEFKKQLLLQDIVWIQGLLALTMELQSGVAGFE